MILGIKRVIKLKVQHYGALFFGTIILFLAGSNNFTSLITQRFEGVSLSNEESADSRSALYSKLLDNIDAVILTGVGEGGYYGEWGTNNFVGREILDEYGFTYTRISAPHNTFFALIYYWGIFPLLIYLILQYQFFSFALRNVFNSYMVFSLVLICSTVSLIFFSNNFNAKDFPMIYGIFLGLKAKYGNLNIFTDFKKIDLAAN